MKMSLLKSAVLAGLAFAALFLFGTAQAQSLGPLIFTTDSVDDAFTEDTNGTVPFGEEVPHVFYIVNAENLLYLELDLGTSVMPAEDNLKPANWDNLLAEGQDGGNASPRTAGA